MLLRETMKEPQWGRRGKEVLVLARENTTPPAKGAGWLP